MHQPRPHFNEPCRSRRPLLPLLRLLPTAALVRRGCQHNHAAITEDGEVTIVRTDEGAKP